ncbi:hypothetical protein FA95DRAFT_61902 [Auriscalpium vulgare]|uniref:Uncharacterized protein n=1 Tax=Auriscalpium vulgare TaxID=40419 RepID=A0ACB8S7M4_9AGAM|nr:hypothetical protein FA95DRAFT_61902 [Auriscalpium vulgare]
MDSTPKPVIHRAPLDGQPPVSDLDDLPRSSSSGSSPGMSQGKGSLDGRTLAEQITQRLVSDTLLVPTTHGRISSSSDSPSSRLSTTTSEPPPQQPTFVNPFPLAVPAYDTHDGSRAPANGLPVRSSAAAFALQSSTSSARPTDQRARTLAPPDSEVLPQRPRSKTAPQPLPSAPREGSGILSTLTGITEERRDASTSLGPVPPPLPAKDYLVPPALQPGSSSSRPNAPHLASLPSFSPRFSFSGAPARLSPAIITRQPQHPIYTLPPITPVPSTPSNSLTRPRSQSLRSMPALPREGTEDLDFADHDNAMLDDLEEEEDDASMLDAGDGDGDDYAVPSGREPSDDESIASRRPFLTLPTRKPSGLPVMKTSPLDVSFLDHLKVSAEDRTTPQGRRGSDYFTSKQLEANTPRTPTAPHTVHVPSRAPERILPSLPPSTPQPQTPWLPQSPRTVPMPSDPEANLLASPSLSRRPSMYHQVSRSMIDIGEMLKKEQKKEQQQQLRTPEPAHRTPKVKGKAPAAPSSQDLPAGADAASADEEPTTAIGPSLRRQHSMPTFNEHTVPPPYPAFGKFGPHIVPRDEEGREGLPKYSNEIYLRAIMPRKMEFSAPGVQSRDRKWRRMLCVLEGTAFRVYKCPAAAAGVGVLGNLWEKTVGVGDIAEPAPPPGSASAKAKRDRDREREQRPVKDENAPSSISDSPVPMAAPTPSSSHRMSSASAPSPVAASAPPTSGSSFVRLVRRAGRSSSTASAGSATSSPTRSRFISIDVPRPSDSAGSSGRRRSFSALRSASSGPTSAASASSPRSSPPQLRKHPLWLEDPGVPPPDEGDLVHTYSLQNAESGLGSDYHKRRNVIRLRMEGEQFLLQAADIAAVVDWIEVRGVVRGAMSGG